VVILLTEFEIQNLFQKYALNTEARELVNLARQNGPVIEIDQRHGNSISMFYSRKMGNRHVKLSSRLIDTPASIIYEHDPACFEFWPLPFSVDLIIDDKKGVTVTRKQHIPRFLTIRSDGFYIDDWKDESWLLKKSYKINDHYFKDTDHRWHYKPAETLFNQIGFHYNLRSTIEHPHSFIDNIRFLEDYQKPECPSLAQDIEELLLDLLSQNCSIPFRKLVNEYNILADDIFKAILKKSIYVDVYNDRLNSPYSLIIHRDMAVSMAYQKINSEINFSIPIPGMGRLLAGTQVKLNGKIYEVCLVGGGNVLLKDNIGNGINLTLEAVTSLYNKNDLEISNNNTSQRPQIKNLADLSHEQLDTANNRLKIIENQKTTEVTDRTVQYWKTEIDESMTTIDKLIALAPKNNKKGNRVPRLPEKVELLAKEIINKIFNTAEGRTATATYGKYLILCKEHKVQPMSYTSFTQRINDGGASIKQREGKRKAYQLEPIPLYFDYSNPIHGARPHEICYVETELFAQLQGNTRIMKDPRLVTKSVDPFRRAIWTLPALHGAINDLFIIKNSRTHPTLGLSPNDYENDRIKETGEREHVIVKYDENLMLMTCPHTKRKIHKIDLIRGVWADNRYYWHDEFRLADKGEEVEVRIEPWMANVIYVYFRKHWVAAITRDQRPYIGRTHREVEIAIREERRLAKEIANKERLGLENAIKMTQLWDPVNFDKRIAIQQSEMSFLYSDLGMGIALPKLIPEIYPIGNPDSSDYDEPPAIIYEEDENLNDSTDENEDYWRCVDGFH
jgi:hypothetical protein